MTTEHIMQLLSSIADGHNNIMYPAEADAIIVALRRLEKLEKAGQGMRDCLSISGTYGLAVVNRPLTLADAIEAWDAATKET